jgi:proteasome assembly chaperone 3
MQFPVSFKQFEASVNGLPTQFSLSAYADRIVIVATQTGTLGTLVHAQKETVLGGGATFQTTTLLGSRDNPLPELCARQLIERISQAGCDQALLLCLGLAAGDRQSPANTDPGIVRTIIELIMEQPVW